MYRGLAYLHSLNIVHRDIKPQNILVELDTNRVVFCDFGSAKIIQNGEKSLSYICSRYYRAPELILGYENYTSYIDVWSIGCVIAEMFLGFPLFIGKSSFNQLYQILSRIGTPPIEDLEEMHVSQHKIFEHQFKSKLESSISINDP